MRKKQTDSFIVQLQETKSKIDEMMERANLKQVQLKDFYTSQYENVVKMFSDVET